MAGVPIISSGSNSSGASALAYFPVINGPLNSNTTEVFRYTVVKQPGRITAISVLVSSNGTSGDSQIRFRNNALDGSILFTITAGLTGEFEETPPGTFDTVVSGDLIDYLLIVGAGGTIILRRLACVFTAFPIVQLGDTYTLLGSSGLTNISSASIVDTQFLSVGKAVSNGTATEAHAQIKFNAPGRLRYFYMVVSSNARTTSTIFKLRKNGATTGSLQMTWTAAETGIKEFTGNDEGIAIGDLVCLCYETGTGTETLAIQHYALHFETTDGSSILMSGSDGGVQTIADGTTGYFTFGGGGNVSTTEADYRADLNLHGALSKLWCYVGTNATTAPSSLCIRKNGVDGNQFITIPAGATGEFQARAPRDIFAPGDEINLKAVNGGGGTLVIRELTAGFNLADEEFPNRIVTIAG